MPFPGCMGLLRISSLVLFLLSSMDTLRGQTKLEFPSAPIPQGESLTLTSREYSPANRRLENAIEPLRRSSRVKSPVTPMAPKRIWLALGSAVYVCAILDMRRTERAVEFDKKHPGYFLRFPERDPLAAPFVKMPAPAYYAAGLSLAFGVNALSWRMGRSQRFHRIWWLPQAVAVSTNGYGIFTATKLPNLR